MEELKNLTFYRSLGGQYHMAAPAITAPKSAVSVTTDALAFRTKVIAAYDRAFVRVVTEKLVCYHDREEDTYAVPSASHPGFYHTVRHLGGSDWANLSCSGPKCGRALACKHRAVVAFARSRHISAVLPRCTPCDPRFCDGGCPDAPKPEPRETPYEAPASEDVLWDAEVALADERYAERLAEQQAEALAFERTLHPVQRPVALTDPVHERHVALGRAAHAVTVDGASPAYRDALRRDEARERELSAQRVAALAAAPRDSDPMAAFF